MSVGRKIRAWTPIIVLGALTFFFWRGLSLDPTEIPSPLIDGPAPEFVLTTLRQADIETSLSEYRGQVVLVNVWGSWCVGCHEEHDMLMRIAQDGLVPIYGINWKDPRNDALAFLTRFGDPYHVSAWDWEGDVSIDWGVYGAPETFLIDADGVIRHKHIGPITDAVWREQIRPRIVALTGAGS